jgi:menaquinone-9 beta-reductase
MLTDGAPTAAAPTADVIVVGAGPAGSAAAIHLARAGRDVLLVDRARFPRDKCCGDGLTTSALRELEDLGLDPADVASWCEVDAAHLRGPGGREVVVPLRPGPGTYAAVARRHDLDACLVDLAVSAGARLLDGRGVSGVVPGDDAAPAIEVEMADGERLRARYVVAADGMWSPVRRSLGLGEAGYLGEWHAFRQYFTHVGPRAASELMVWFEPDLLPGYAWSFPLPGGVANVGFGIRRGGSVTTQAMKTLWPELLGRPHIAAFLGPDARPESPHRAWPIPASIERSTLTGAGGRVLLVGDAAAATDPMTGEGIGQALLTGRWAAEAIVAAGALDPVRAARLYRHHVQSELEPDALVARLLSGVLRWPLGARAAVRVAGSGAWVSEQFGRWLFEDYPRALLLTPWRWGSRARRPGPGAPDHLASRRRRAPGVTMSRRSAGAWSEPG